MKIWKTAVLGFFVIGATNLIGQETVGLRATGDENILHALIRVGRAGSIALGIVQPNDGALCRTITGIIPEHPSNTADTIKQLADQAGYEVTQSAGALVVKSHNVQGKLATAMNYRFSRFPSMEGTMQYMGMNLQGWLEVSVNGAKGYGLSNAYSMEAKVLKLPESASSTTMEIASRIIGLGPKGVWILSEDPNPDGQSGATHIRTYSYEDNVLSLDNLQCVIPPPKEPSSRKHQ